MRLVITLVVLIVPLSVSATSFIGIYTNPNPYEEDVCHVDIELGAQTSIYVLALADTEIFPSGITAAEFKINNMPPSDFAQGGLITTTWTSDVVVGDPWTDFSIAWSTPQMGPAVLIGELAFLSLASYWIYDDHVMEVVVGDICDCLVLVDDSFESVDVMGGFFTLNCTSICECVLQLPPVATRESSWTDVKSLY